MKKLLRLSAWILGAVIVLGGVLYGVGLRVVVRGGGRVSLAFVESAETRARQLERHRESQRAQAAGTTAASGSALPGPAGAVGGGTGASEGTPAGTGSPLPPSPGPGSVLSSPATPAAGAAPYWTDFRGPARDGHYREVPISASWPVAGLAPLWKQPIGEGYASFVVADGRAFTIEQRGPEEVVAAYEVATGREIWTHRWRARFSEMMGGDGPRATPVWSDGLLYALGGTGDLRCLDASTGRLVWHKNILEDNGASNLQWGMAASPLVVDDTVVVLPGGSGGRSIVAYDRRTGARAWSALDDRQSYSSPMLVTIAGVRQLVVLSATRLMGVTPGEGRLLWQYPWTTQYDVNAGQPLLIGDNRVFISSGYGTGAAVVEITRTGDAFAVREIWRNIRMKNQFTSSVLHDGFIYGLDESILACVDAATGELKWKGGRYGYGQVLLASGRLVVLTEDGDLVLVRATPEKHDELARFSAIEGKTWNHPAIAGGILLVRNIQEMAAFDLRVR